MFRIFLALILLPSIVRADLSFFCDPDEPAVIEQTLAQDGYICTPDGCFPVPSEGGFFSSDNVLDNSNDGNAYYSYGYSPLRNRVFYRFANFRERVFSLRGNGPLRRFFQRFR